MATIASKKAILIQDWTFQSSPAKSKTRPVGGDLGLPFLLLLAG
jgi:hypothetical protein